MRFDSDIHHRRSIRLKSYDYASAGAYFVTVCVQGRECLFGTVENGGMAVNEAGRMVEEWWLKIPGKFGNVAPDDYVIMPNHFHAIVTLVGADPCVRPGFDSDPCVRPALDPGIENQGAHVGAEEPGAHMGAEEPGAHVGAPLHRIVQWFKTMTTNAYIHSVHAHAWRPFPGRLWQRNYHERIIRNDDELANIRAYIRGNPARWHEDADNPANRPSGRPQVSACAAEPNLEGRRAIVVIARNWE
ncbi:transposase [Geoalkalibacter halelectricus]|uniref:transposase n=1 Tax=Geoalkalibacter halelectricus TaxID=2847045 RepID=UPI003D1AF188